tara:strand:+ start:114 stop:287 length:174 start_codon:yes stop_codon:yes gene_type:complete
LGAIGRIEGKQSNLGRVSKKEEEALFNGTHKRLALKQAVLGGLIYTTLIYFISMIIF